MPYRTLFILFMVGLFCYYYWTTPSAHVVEVDAARVDPANNGKLVYLAGTVDLTDRELSVGPYRATVKPYWVSNCALHSGETVTVIGLQRSERLVNFGLAEACSLRRTTRTARKGFRQWNPLISSSTST